MGSIFVLLGSINQLIDGFNITAWIFYCLVFIAVIIMRFTKRKEKRPFKVLYTHTHTIITIPFCLHEGIDSLSGLLMVLCQKPVLNLRLKF